MHYHFSQNKNRKPMVTETANRNSYLYSVNLFVVAFLLS